MAASSPLEAPIAHLTAHPKETVMITFARRLAVYVERGQEAFPGLAS